MAYATIDDLRAELRNFEPDADEDRWQDKLDEAQRTIENVCHRRFEAAAPETRYIDCLFPDVDGLVLTLPWDCCRITGITNGDGTAVAVNAYVTRPRLRTVSGGESLLPGTPEAWPFYAIQLKANAGVNWTYDTDPEEAIAVTGYWAFSETPPADIKAATIRLADWFYHQADNLTDVDENKASRSGVLLTMMDLPLDVQRRLQRYVKLI